MRGELLALASAACFALANVTIARGAPKGAGDNGVFLSLLLSTGIAGLIWLVLSLKNGFAPVTTTALLWLAGAGVFTAFIGRVFLYASIQHLGAMRASAVKRLNPVFAVLLGVLVMGDSLRGGSALGALLILASFAVLVAGSWQRDPDPGKGGLARRALALGYVYGPVSALGYATGYMLRKMGLNEMPDPFFGTMVGTATGALLYLVAAAFSAQYRGAVRATFSGFNPWLWLAGVMGSFGQIFYFAALNVSTMSQVALLASMEVFMTIFLGWLILREKIRRSIVLAALLGVAGTAVLVGL